MRAYLLATPDFPDSRQYIDGYILYVFNLYICIYVRCACRFREVKTFDVKNAARRSSSLVCVEGMVVFIVYLKDSSTKQFQVAWAVSSDFDDGILGARQARTNNLTERAEKGVITYRMGKWMLGDGV